MAGCYFALFFWFLTQITAKKFSSPFVQAKTLNIYITNGIKQIKFKLRCTEIFWTQTLAKKCPPWFSSPFPRKILNIYTKKDITLINLNTLTHAEHFIEVSYTFSQQFSQFWPLTKSESLQCFVNLWTKKVLPLPACPLPHWSLKFQHSKYLARSVNFRS